MLFYWFVYVQDSSKNKKHVCLVKDNKLSFPVIHAFIFVERWADTDVNLFCGFGNFYAFYLSSPRKRKSPYPVPRPPSRKSVIHVQGIHIV